MQGEFKKFLKAEGLKQAYVARSLGVSSSQLSQWISQKYQGDTATLEAALRNFMDNYTTKRKETSDSMPVQPLHNFNSAMFVAEEAIVNEEMVVLYGIPGSGKSVVAREFVSRHPEAVFIEVVPGIRPDSLLKAIASALGVSGLRAGDELIWEISREFGRRDGVLVIDEAEHLTVKGLEVIRRIHDFSQVPVVLVGTYGLIKNLKGNNGELLQLYSRIQGRWEFKESSSEDMERLFGPLSPVICRYTRHLRRAVNLYAKAKRFAAMNQEQLNAGHIEAASTMLFLD